MNDMNDKVDEPSEDDPAERFTIDERFNFEVPVSDSHDDISDAKTISSDAKLSLGNNSDVKSDAMIGCKIDNYEIISEIGRGGFGYVYKAKDTSLQRYAALKFLRSPLDSNFNRLFSREAQVIANLGKHPSIVQIYQWGEFRGNHYFALEYLDQSGDALLKQSRNPLPLKRTLEIIADCAEALQFAHENNVLHRDIKPANILIDSKTNKAKLCDFGLAKFQNMGISTEPNLLAGSPPYMSPEQVLGSEIDERADIYSLGVTLYELLSGQLPVTGENHHQVFDKIRRNKSVPLTKFRPDLPASVKNVVTKATSPKPDDRYQTAEEMCRTIRSILEDLETSGQTRSIRSEIGRRRLTARSLLLGTAACVIALGILFSMVSDNRTGQEPESNSFWKPSIAEAKEKIETEQYETAIGFLNNYLSEHPADAQAHYALGYAFLFQDDYDSAKQSFEKVSDEALRLEGLAALAHAQNGESSRDRLLEIYPSKSTPYPGVLIALLDVGKEDYETAKSTLSAINGDDLLFRWQQIQLNELMQRVENAINGVSALAESVQREKLRIQKLKADQRTQDAVRKQIENIQELASRDDYEPIDPSELWTTRRPITFRISPAEGESRINGLAEQLPPQLAVNLDEQDELPINIVDRESIGDTLYEQELSSLSTAQDRINLMRLNGAKFMLECKLGEFGDTENVRIKIIDTETTDSIPFDTIDIDETMSLPELIDTLVSQIIEKISIRYPLQGILRNTEEGSIINIGTAVGVEPGMKFAVYTEPDTNKLLDRISVTVEENLGTNSAIVKLEGFTPETIAESGWFVREIREP